MFSRPGRGILLVTLVFAIVAVMLLGTLPLWLDEILQLIEARDGTTIEMIHRLPYQAGASPLGYLVQRAALPMTGSGERGARIPALIFGIASVLFAGMVAIELGVTRPWLAALIFASFPLTLRYAIEARLYSQALFLSILATWLYLRMTKRPGVPIATGVAVAFTAAVCTMPYTIFIGIALVVWSMWNREWRAAIFGGSAVFLAGVAFLPWYLWARSVWAHDIAVSHSQFAASPKTLLMIFREATGAGYYGSGLLLIACVLAWIAPSIPARVRTLLILLIAVPLIGGLAGDFATGYFAAARQFLWILPAAAILASSSRSREVATVFAAAIVIIGSIQSYKYFTAPHENWKVAADVLVEKTREGRSVEVVPPQNARLYRFFRSDLRTVTDGHGMALAITPATSAEDRDRAIARMLSDGYVKTGATFTGGSTILDFELRSAEK